jgi:hypothetical protein
MIENIEKYQRKAIVGLHGRILKPVIDDYYKALSVYCYYSPTIEDIWVHMLGTGTTAFHTDTIEVCYSNFPLPNTADLQLAILAQKQEVPMLCVKHTGQEIRTMKVPESLWDRRDALRKINTDLTNTITRQLFYMPQVI